MKDFANKLAVITGGGTGMGRELSHQLATQGCHVALCDVSLENMAETKRLCEQAAPPGTVVSTFQADVSVEEQIQAFCEAIKKEHQTEQINLLFNNAGIGGVGSFIKDNRADWEKTFNVCWFGVYYCTRVFIPMLVASEEGHIINTSSVNGFWASIGTQTPHTSYCAAKFAVKGFTEALLTELRLYAPHIKVSLVMPGHIGTAIIANTTKVLGKGDPLEMSVAEVAVIRARYANSGHPLVNMTDDEIRERVKNRERNFINNAPCTAAQAATIILEGVRNEQWRILVGDDAHIIDEMVREAPEMAYEAHFMEQLRERTGWQLGR